MPQIIAIGETLVEIMRPSAGQSLDQPGEFRGPFPSGAPAIFAVAAARLGMDVGFIGAVGQDAFGGLMHECFVNEGVDASQMQFPPGCSTGCAFVAYDAAGEREFVFHIRHAAAGALVPEKISPDYFKNVEWLHLSGSTLALNENSRATCLWALELTLAQGGKISLDPNLRLELMPLERTCQVLAPFIQAADLLLPTTVEARALTAQLDDDCAAQALVVKPDAIVALKRGAAGCSVYWRGERLDVPGLAVEEVDPTGAGDCFSAAFIAGLEAGWPLEQAGRFANAAGALAVTRMGPIEGAPTPQQVRQLLAQNH